ncbi:MAG: penicillin-binding protein [Tetrasphaera sp.]|jgi:membrane peptidoglycan carboxypeptidase|nr:penicillin-binding protein [Tetrasphaera sp.]
MSPRPDRASMPHLMSLLAAFVAVSVGMGVLAAGIFIPAVGALGSATAKTVKAFDEIPDDFEPGALAQQSRIYDADGRTIATPYDQNRIIVKLSQIAPIMQKAQVAIEDDRFFEHGPIDIRGTFRAFFNNASGNATQGGSSITQQYVKLTLQEEALQRGDDAAAQEAVSVNYARKLREMRLAMHVEETMTKKQILAGYMNLAYYGDLAYGVEAAAMHYFNVHASELNLSQAATLAGVVQSPGSSDPHNYPEVAERRRNVVLDRMQQLGIITATEAADAKKPTVKSMLNLSEREGGTCARSEEPFFCQYVMEYMLGLKALGANRAERLLNINRGGLRIHTTLRTDWQQEIFRDLTARVPSGDPSGVGAAAAVVEPGTGKLRAMVQTSVFDWTAKKSTVASTSQSWVVPQKYKGTLGFPIGSTAKVFTIVTALERGWPVNGTIPAPPAGPAASQAHIFEPNVYHDACGSADPWPVRNDYTTTVPAMPFRDATRNSVNTAFAATMIAVGGCDVRATMTKMGLLDGAGEPTQPAPSSLVLGSGSVPPLTLANSYATLAADGKYCDINPIESITTSNGTKIKLPETKCKQVISPDVARGTTELLKGVITSGTGTKVGWYFHRPAAGKTGTHEGHQQSWFVGYTPQLATAVFVGTPIVARDMDNIVVGGTYYPHIFGGDIAAPLWGQIMEQISRDLPWKDFPAPSSAILYGNLSPLPGVMGMSLDGAIATLRASGFDGYYLGTQNSTAPAGTVVATAPSGSAAKGTAVGLYLSTGFVPKPPPTKTPTSTSTSPTSGPTTPSGSPTTPKTPTPTSPSPSSTATPTG